jgi:hypothetical protein
VLAVPPALPTLSEGALNTGSYENPTRHRYPDGLLTHRYIPFGAQSDGVSDHCEDEAVNETMVVVDSRETVDMQNAAGADEDENEIQIVESISVPTKDHKKDRKKGKGAGSRGAGEREKNKSEEKSKAKKRKADTDASPTDSKKTKKSKMVG